MMMDWTNIYENEMPAYTNRLIAPNTDHALIPNVFAVISDVCNFIKFFSVLDRPVEERPYINHVYNNETGELSVTVPS